MREVARSADHANIYDVALVDRVAHRGTGRIHFARLFESAGACHFVDVAVLPPGTSIGRHRHPRTEQEFYLVLDGQGTMWCNGAEFSVRPGDLIRNPPGGEHGLENTGRGDLRIFVFAADATEGSGS